MNKPRVIILNWQFIYILIILFLLGMGGWLLLNLTLVTNNSFSALVSGKTIVIDAGHGGADPGARSARGLTEKELNLDIALRLKRYLSRVGVYCIMTRESDFDFFNYENGQKTPKRRDLFQRAKIANQSKADLFLSIHANMFPQSIYYGAQTFYEANNPHAKTLAQVIQQELVNNLDSQNKRKARPGDYRVLKEVEMPGVIIETGFLSNQKEAEKLGKANYREAVARAIFQGVIQYFIGTQGASQIKND